MGMSEWLGRRLEHVCLFLHFGEALLNVVINHCWRRFTPVSLLTQFLTLLVQMALCRILVIWCFYFYSSRTMPGLKERGLIPFLRKLLLVVQESLIGAWILYSVLHPFARILTVPFEQPGESLVVYPVLFIHGYACNAGYWYPILRYLHQHGCRRLYSISLRPLYLDIASFAEQVDQKVEDIVKETGSEKIVLVGHSMGGLVARAYMKWRNAKRVAKLVTMQTPHQGTEIVWTPIARALIRGDSVSEMMPGSQFLTDLGSPEESNLAGAIPMTSVFSYHDTLITPQESSIMAAPNTINIYCSGIGHLAMPFFPSIQKLVLMELLRAE